MRRLWVVVWTLALVGAALAVSSPAAFAAALPQSPHSAPLPPTPPARGTPAAAPTPTPTPPPPPQVVNVTPTQASPGDSVTVSGSGFPPGSRAQVYLDGPNHPLGPSVVVGNDGTFTTPATIPAGATADLHQICAQVNSTTPACAQLQVTAAAPTPAPTPTAVATPTPAAPTAAPTVAPTPASASNGLLSSLFPWILIPILILVILAVIAIILLVRSRRSRAGGAGTAPPPPAFGDPRGGGQPTVTHRSPRGYQAPGEPGEDSVPRGYRRQGIGAPVRGEPLPGRGDQPGLRDPNYGNPELPGGGRGWAPDDDRRGLPGRPGGGSLPPSSRRPPGLPPRDEDDDDPFSAPPPR